ncbi:GspH/FimT family protein [Deinococcus pimensis]|uniref:GspH/FimT family protein n=1 Tax=Deinococcus pimensis TaxID=309888 RepID=UPI0004873C1E|nr:GspH/FimT family protein [Deinococcus pimensis]
MKSTPAGPARPPRPHGTRPHASRAGVSVVEFLVVIVVVALMAAVGVLGFERLTAPLDDEALELAGLLQGARARALSTTGAVRVEVRPGSATVLTARDCTRPANEWTSVTNLNLTFKNAVKFVPPSSNVTTVRVCFDSRGRADSNANFLLTRGSRSRTVEVMLIGSVRIRT